ncbi:MAG: ATP-dependent sacrificial sulfur transferase LarE [Methanobacteriota archaeon]|nr:MAG: ATP-dependent sacrificial sulfur transferase LarE [Euryarchaeota archaeon]
MDAHLRSAYERMRDAAAAKGRVIVAYSGGVDSGLVARTVHDAIGGRALAILADTESFSRRELVEAREEAEEIGIPLRVVGMSELTSEDYRRNPANRCYFCREGLADELVPIARREGFAAIADGVNVSDLGDVRPGIRAMDEAGFWHPLVEAGLSKADVRALARGLGLSFWDKPSNACLSSRVPHGTPITVELLRRVETAEEVLRGRGFRQVRVRHEQETARIEVPPEDIPRLRTMELEVAAALRAIGYRSVVIDPAGYRSLG